jgi:hypothetical protein
MGKRREQVAAAVADMWLGQQAIYDFQLVPRYKVAMSPKQEIRKD